MTVLVLGDQLTRRHGPLARRPDEPALMIDAASFADDKSEDERAAIRERASELRDGASDGMR